MEYILLICGIFWIVAGLIANTKNPVLFKVLPFFTGVATCLCAMDLMEWVNIFK